MFDQARALESAMRSSESYTVPSPSVNAPVPPTPAPIKGQSDPSTLAALEPEAQACFFRENSKHPRSSCPAHDAICLKC